MRVLGIKGYFRRRMKRANRKRLLEMLPKAAVCAEVGVWRGDFSKDILSVTAPKKLHLIDAWERFPSIGGTRYSRLDFGAAQAIVLKRYGDLDNVEIHHGRSAEVLAGFPDSYFDWVYIDGDHSYEAVLEDLTLALSKVKPDGLIAGDDYRRDGVHQAVHEVQRPVEELAGRQYLIRCTP